MTSGWVWSRTTTPVLGAAESVAMLMELGSMPDVVQKDVVRELERRVNDGSLQMSAFGLVGLLKRTKELGLKSRLRQQRF